MVQIVLFVGTVIMMLGLTISPASEFRMKVDAATLKKGNSLTNQFLGSSTVEYKNRIYYSVHGKLFSVKKDGTDKRLVYTISDEISEYGIDEFVIYKGNVYAEYYDTDGYSLICFSLEGGKIEKLGYISGLSLVGNKLYYSKAKPVKESWYIAMKPTEIRVRNLDTNKDRLVRKGKGSLQASDGKYLYYRIIGDNGDYYFYRCDMNGKHQKKIYYAKNSVGNNMVNGDYVYYATQDESNSIYQVNIKTNNKRKICSNKNMIGSLLVKDHQLYACDSLSGIYKIDISTGKKEMISKGKVNSFYGLHGEVLIFDEYVESDTLENVTIFLSRLDGKEKKTLGMYYAP